KSRAEVRGLARGGVVFRIDIRTTGLWIESFESRLLDVGLAVDKGDLAVTALQKIHVAVAGDIDQTFDRPAIAPEVDQDRRRNFVPVPRFVWSVLEVPFDFSCRRIDCDRGSGIEVVAWPLISHPGAAIPDSPECEIGFRIVVTRNPDRTAAGLPLVAVGPGFASVFPRC